MGINHVAKPLKPSKMTHQGFLFFLKYGINSVESGLGDAVEVVGLKMDKKTTQVQTCKKPFVNTCKEGVGVGKENERDYS